MKLTIYIFLLFITFACRKEFTSIEKTEITSVIENDFFNDSIYKVNQFNVISTNDSVLNFGRVKIYDDSTLNVIWDGEWRNLRQETFSLPLRKKYKLTFELYRLFEDRQIIDFSSFQYINNNKIPTKFQLLSAEVNPSIIGVEDLFGLNAQGSNSRSVLIITDLSIEAVSEDEFERNIVTKEITYYQKAHTPKKLSFVFNNVFFDTKKMENNIPKWMHYQFNFYYPLDFSDTGNSTGEYRNINFIIRPKVKFDNQEVYQNIEYTFENDPDYTSSGADYSGVLTIKWIYEN